MPCRSVLITSSESHPVPSSNTFGLITLQIQTFSTKRGNVRKRLCSSRHHSMHSPQACPNPCENYTISLQFPPMITYISLWYEYRYDVFSFSRLLLCVYSSSLWRMCGARGWGGRELIVCLLIVTLVVLCIYSQPVTLCNMSNIHIVCTMLDNYYHRTDNYKDA